MTLPPERIGDKGQRFEVKFSRDVEALDDEHVLGWADDLISAEAMASAWRLHPQGYYVWVVDRQAPTVNEAKEAKGGENGG